MKKKISARHIDVVNKVLVAIDDIELSDSYKKIYRLRDEAYNNLLSVFGEYKSDSEIRDFIGQLETAIYPKQTMINEYHRTFFCAHK